MLLFMYHSSLTHFLCFSIISLYLSPYFSFLFCSLSAFRLAFLARYSCFSASVIRLRSGSFSESVDFRSSLPKRTHQAGTDTGYFSTSPRNENVSYRTRTHLKSVIRSALANALASFFLQSEKQVMITGDWNAYSDVPS